MPNKKRNKNPTHSGGEEDTTPPTTAVVPEVVADSSAPSDQPRQEDPQQQHEQQNNNIPHQPALRIAAVTTPTTASSSAADYFGLLTPSDCGSPAQKESISELAPPSAAARTHHINNEDGGSTEPDSNKQQQQQQQQHGNHSHKRRKEPKRGPNGTPDDAYLEADPFLSLPPPQLEALREQLIQQQQQRSVAASSAASRSASVSATPSLGATASATPPALVATVDRSPLVHAAQTQTQQQTVGQQTLLGVPVSTATTASAVPPSALITALSNKRVKMSSLVPKMRHASLRPLLMKTLKAAVKSFVCAAIGRLLIGLVKSVARSGLSKNRFVSLARREIFTSNPFKWGTVAAGMSCYRLLQQLVLRVSPHMPVPVSCAIGGGLASLPLMVLNVQTRTELGLYFAVRAIHGAICSEWDRIPMPESWRKFKDWTVVYMVFLAVEILYTYSFYPNTHSPAYVAFMDSNTKQHPDTMHCLAAVVRREYSPYFMKFYKLHNLNVVTPEYAQMAAEGCGGCVLKPGARVMNINDMRESCVFLHPYTNSCIYHYLNLSFRHFFTVSVPLYLPLKLSTTFLFGMKRVIRQPITTMRKVLTSSLTSSAFLTLYACVCHLMLCCGANLQVHSPIGTCMMASLCGLATILEPRSRRNDLALYCSLHGLRSFVGLLHVKGLIPKPTSEWVFWLQTVSIAALFYQYDEKYDYIHANIQGVCGWLLKEKRHSKEEVAYALEWQQRQDAIKSSILSDPTLLSALVEMKEQMDGASSSDVEERDSSAAKETRRREEVAEEITKEGDS